MAAAPTFRRGEIIAKRFQVVTKSGETAMWVGYHACDQANHSNSGEKGNIPEPDVLVKIVKPDLLPEPAMRVQLVRDLQRMRGLQHPGLPRLIDVQALDEHNTVVLIEGIQAGLSQGVLLRRMVTFRQKERFPLEEVRRIGAQLASALSYIHGQMLSHGDLRLESVLLRPDGAKLCDIGLGAAMPRQLYLEAVKKVSEFELLAPEVRAGNRPDPRADVYGLAALYKHLLSVGQSEAWDALMAEKPAMGTVLMRGMAEQPGERYSSIEALIADIEAVALTGAPIRRRLAPTPLAMAIAAGRVSQDELTRPVEEMVPESARSRRTTGIFESGAVINPVSGVPAGKMSIGTIPPQLQGPSSARSGRITSGGASANSTETNPSAVSRDGNPASALSNGPASATSKGPASATSKGPASATSRGPASANSKGPGQSRGSASANSQGPASASSKGPGPSSTAADGSPAADGAAQPVGASSRSKDPRVAGDKPKDVSPLTASPDPATAPRQVPEPAPTDKPDDSGSKTREPSPTDRAAADSNERNPGDSGIRKRSGDGRPSPSSRTGRTESPSQRSRSDGSIPRSRSSDSLRIDKSASSTLNLPPGMLVASRTALLGALILAALVGALVAVLVMLLLRPSDLLVSPAVPPPAVVPAPVEPRPEPKSPTPPAAPEPKLPLPTSEVPVVPIEPSTPTSGQPTADTGPAAAPGTSATPAAPTGSRPALPLRLLSDPPIDSAPKAPSGPLKTTKPPVHTGAPRAAPSRTAPAPQKGTF